MCNNLVRLCDVLALIQGIETAALMPDRAEGPYVKRGAESGIGRGLYAPGQAERTTTVDGAGASA